MNEELYQRELFAFQEKIALSELEKAKANQRVMEIKYDLARFNLEFFLTVMKNRQQEQHPAADSTTTKET